MIALHTRSDICLRETEVIASGALSSIEPVESLERTVRSEYGKKAPVIAMHIRDCQCFRMKKVYPTEN